MLNPKAAQEEPAAPFPSSRTYSPNVELSRRLVRVLGTTGWSILVRRTGRGKKVDLGLHRGRASRLYDVLGGVSAAGLVWPG